MQDILATIASRQTQKLRADTLNNAFIQALDWDRIITSLSAVFLAFKAMDDLYINPCSQGNEW